MRQKIRALVEEDTSLDAEEKIAVILEETSDEDAEGNQNPKSIGKQRKKRSERRSALSKRAENRATEALDIVEDDREDEVDEGDRNEDWEEGGAMLESEWTAETVDRRVDEFMLELMKQGKEQGELDDDRTPQEDGFDILEASSEDDG